MIGETVGNYRIIGPLGAGGMGVVYTAEHLAIGRRAAVKVLNAEFAQNEEWVNRFFNEARAATAVGHPGIVEIFDFGKLPTGAPYIVMELLKGENLASRLHRVGRLPAAEARNVAVQAASILGAAHDKRIVHRDLKPDNIFLVPNELMPQGEMVKILDFGIAKLGVDPDRQPLVNTRTGSLLGTPVYMSPEQCLGTRAVDHRADIYALGLILYEMICGAPPFLSDGFGEMVNLHLNVLPQRPSERAPDVAPDIESVILKALSKEPAFRQQSMSEIAMALGGRPTPARQTLSSAEVTREPSSMPPSGTLKFEPQVPPARPLMTTLSGGAVETQAPREPKRPRLGPIGIVVGLAAGGVGAALLVSQWRGSAPVGPGTHIGAVAAPAPSRKEVPPAATGLPAPTPGQPAAPGSPSALVAAPSPPILATPQTTFDPKGLRKKDRTRAGNERSGATAERKRGVGTAAPSDESPRVVPTETPPSEKERATAGPKRAPFYRGSELEIETGFPERRP